MDFLRSEENKLIQAIRKRDWPEVRSISETEQHLINTVDQDGDTPLTYAVWDYAPEDVMLLLIENAAAEDLEYEYELGKTILHHLAANAYPSALRRALEITTRKINQRDCHGQTPLHHCLASWHSYDSQRETGLYLLTYGASLSIKDMKGNTPLDLYDDNECSEYEKHTRDENKKKLRELFEELSVPAEILARGEEAVKAFKDAIRNGEIIVVNSRIMFLGNEGVGKTSCVNAMLGKAFNENEQSTDGIVTTTVFQTVGEDFSKWEEQTDVDECELTKQIHDQAIAANIAKKLKQQPESQQNTSNSASLPASLSASDPGRISPSDSTESSMIKDIFNSIFKNVEGTPYENHVDHEMYVVDNTAESDKGIERLKKNDEFPEAVMTLQKRSEGYRVSKDTGVVSTNQLMTNEMLKKVVDNLANKSSGPSGVTCIWDYAGQLTYYITHRFFLTDGSSYGVVFSLLDDLNALAKPRASDKRPFEMTNLQMNIFWIRSIYEHAVLRHSARNQILINGLISSPPICLVATHKDKLSGSEEDKHILIKDIFNKIFKEIEGTPYENHVDREMYVVDNTAESDKGIEKLKKNVGGYMKAMAKTVPINWVDFQSKVQEVGKRRVRMSLDQITKLSVECGISSEITIHVLNYLNDLGIILYSPTNKKLKNIVITNIHMLIGIFMKIITVVKPDDDDKTAPVMIRYWRKLDEEGILAEQLLRHLWRNELSTGKDNDDIFEEFLELMKTFGLLFEKGSQEGSRVFIVPSRMNLKTDNLEVKKDEEQTVSIYVTPKDFLPDAIYSVLVVKLIDLSQDKACSGDPELFQNQAEIGFDNMHYLRMGVVCINNKRSLKLEITRRTEIDEYGKKKSASKPQAIACMEILHVLRLHLDDLYPSNDGYTLNILCPVCSAGSNKGKLHLKSLDDCLKADIIPCGTNTTSTARIHSLFQAGLSFSKEIKNFNALQSLITDMGTKQMRKYFMMKGQLRDKHVVGKFLQFQRQKGVLTDEDFGDQATKIFTADADIDTFDITVLMLLIKRCIYTYSSKGDTFWENPPDDKDTSELANLRRIQLYKETILDCSHSNRVTDEEFDKQWKKLTTIFRGIGVSDEGVQKYRKQYIAASIRGFEQENIEEIKNFQAVLSVVIDVGTVTMRDYFLEVAKLDKKDVGKYLMNEKRKGSFRNVKTIPPVQYTKMFTPTADIETFDISIMYLIIRNCCCTIPVSFWKNPDRLPNLVHIHHYRNTKLAHTPNSKMSTKDFEIEWKKVRSMLHAAGASFNDIDKYKALRFIK